jgi:hypothetical protein
MVLVIVNRIYSLLTEIPLMCLQWVYFVAFFKLKNQMQSFRRTCGNLLTVSWIILILTLFTFNAIISNSAQIIIRFINLSEADKESVEDLLIITSTFIMDALIFTNGIAFIFLFKRIAEARFSQGRSRQRLDSSVDN